MSVLTEKPGTLFMRPQTKVEIPADILAWNFLTKHPWQKKAWEKFTTLGLPKTGDEAYTFISLSDMRAALSQKPNTELQSTLNWEENPVESIPSSQVDGNLHVAWFDALTKENDIPALQAVAFSSQISFFELKAKKTSQLNLNVKQDRSDIALFFQVAPGAAVKLRIKSEVAENAFLNAALYFHLEENAELEIVSEDFSPGILTQKIHFGLQKNSRLQFTSATSGSRLQRLALQVELHEPLAQAEIRGATALGTNRRGHRYIRVQHHAPNCVSKQLFKTVAGGNSRSGIDGTVMVDRGAQGTEAKQMIQQLLLSKEAKVDSKPQLLIFADDVKCSHGSAVGKMDAEQKFYLLSRGLDSNTANTLLTQAFLAEALTLLGSEKNKILTQLLSGIS